MARYWNFCLFKTALIIFSLFFSAQSYAKEVQPRVAIIIDDIGGKKDEVDRLEGIDFPFTVSIFPGAKFSEKLAKQAHEKGFEVLIHMPMEALNKKMDPGPYAIYTKMNNETIVRTLNANFKKVPFAVGINNHMGSKVTENPRCMNVILAELKKHGLIFIDSFVVNKSVGFKLAKHHGFPYIKRDVFLDNEDKREYIDQQLNQLMQEALKKGKALGICHITHKNSIPAIKDFISVMKEKGIIFCYASEL